MIINDNSIKQGFVVPLPTQSIGEQYWVQVAQKSNGLTREYLIIQNLSSVSPFYISFHKPRKSSIFGNYAIEGMIELLPKQGWQEIGEVHQGDVFIFINKQILTETLDENGLPNGAPFASVNYNGAYDFFNNELKQLLPPIYN